MATACAASVGALALPAQALADAPAPARATHSTPARSTKPVAPATALSTQKGRDLFSAVFFDIGPYAGKLAEFHAGGADAYRVHRSARVKHDPERLRALARYLDDQSETKSAQAARSAANTVGRAPTTNKLSTDAARKLLLDTIDRQDSTFFRRFSAAVASANPAKIDAALVDAGHVTIAAVETLKGENALGNVTLGPQGVVEIVVVVVLVIFIAIAVTAVTIDKDSPSYQPHGGGELKIPASVLQRAELASLIAKRLSRV